MLLTLSLLFYYVEAIYFRMGNISMTIPVDKEILSSKDVPITTFYATGESPLNYSIIGSPFLRISQIGEVSFSKTLSEADVQKLDGISSKVSIQESSSKQVVTSFYVDFLPFKFFDCDFIVEDLCFWKMVQYYVQENSEPTLLGSLTSPFLTKICSSCNINYTILNNNEEFRIVSSDKSYFLYSTKSLDRETKSQYFIKVLCTVENAEHSVRNVTKNLLVIVLDVDDNPPKAQEKIIKINMSSKHIHKDEFAEHKNLIFNDEDTVAVNRYKPTVLNDTLKILKAECNKFPDDHLKEEVQTAIHCKLKFTKTIPVEKWTYSIVLQLNDTSLNNGNKTVTVPIDLYFPNESGYHPELFKEQIKPPRLYPSNKVKIFRTAAPLARLTQPLSKHLNAVKNFTIKSIIPQHRDIFRITNSTGIVFVHDSRHLRDAPEYVKLNISWLNNINTREYDEIEVHIINEPTKTCTSVIDLQDWTFCSEINNPDKCLSPKTCALSTGGSPNVDRRDRPHRCMWRGEKNPSNEITTLYSTCTPDITTCPDEICDELEELHDLICPQDCTRDVLIPSEGNKNTGRGIFRGSGVCVCNIHGKCYCNPVEYNTDLTIPTKKRKPHKIISKNMTDTASNYSFPIQTNITNHTANVTSKILGIEFDRCGTICVFGMVAGVLFLLAAIAVIVICWKLDSVHKAVRNKYSADNHDLSAPLSDYIDRSLPDPMPLNFDMTTSLADTAILNIISKYAPDPKWEFSRNQLVIEQTLGEGEFGKVLKAKALNIAGQLGYSTVAVKTLKDDARESELNDLLSEYQLLKEVSHPNVIRLLGVCTAPGGPIYLIIEFAEYGSLRNYLRKTRYLKSECEELPTSAIENEVHYDEPNLSKVTSREIISFAWQICKGMSYLSEIKLVHRDLAARNVLLAAEKICKISDFGLTRDIYEDDAYFKKSKGRVPVKWMAPESLSDHVYTNKSDIWSFGILIWELVTLGATPYPGIAVQNLFHLLKQGYRMERPDNCSSTLYNIMRNCWHIDPEQRPTFQELSSMFEKMLSNEVEYLDLANNAIHNRSYFCSPFEDILEHSRKSEISSVNYLSKSQSYVKCGSGDKFQDNSNFLTEPDKNQNDINTQGYETPVKISKKVQTPTNDCPQYYTDMAAGKSK